MAEEKRHEMMESLFGAESGDSDEEAVPGPAPHRNSPSPSPSPSRSHSPSHSRSPSRSHSPSRSPSPLPSDSYSGNEAVAVGEEEAESHGERVESGPEREESEAERDESEVEREDSDEDGSDTERRLEVPEVRHPRLERPRGRQQISSGSDESQDAHGGEEGDEVGQTLVEESAHEDDGQKPGGVTELQDVFGYSDEDDEEEVATKKGYEHSPREEGMASDDDGVGQRDIGPEDIVADEEDLSEHSDDDRQQRIKEKPVGPPLELEVPPRPPLAQPDKMHLVRVSNIMGIESKPFDPKTFIEEEAFVMDEAGQSRLRLEDNVARWRMTRSRDGRTSFESNARFVKWSDGSMQLLIGNEVLDISVQSAQQDQAHLFVRHGKGILQSQGRLLQKMKFMPSSLTSKSHKLLTALVDSRNRKIYKVKNVVTNVDPEREKEEKEKQAEQKNRSREDLRRKQEKITRKYVPVRERELQLSPKYLENALEEEDEAEDMAERRRALDARHFEEQLEEEGRAEKRILNAKRAQHMQSSMKKAKGRQPPQASRRRSYSDESEAEESEYESDDDHPERGANEEAEEEEEPEREYEDEEEEEEAAAEEEEEQEEEEEEEEESGRRNDYNEREDDNEDDGNRKRRDREEEWQEESPPRKPVQRRRVVVSDSEDED